MKLSSLHGAFLLSCVFGFAGTTWSAPVADTSALGAPGFKASPERPVGWRGDGTGHFPGATPPASWSRTQNGDGYTVKGIAWMTPLPNGGISSPIVVSNRIFVTSEPSDLVCADKVTGRLLWIHSNPEFEGLSEEECKADPAFKGKLPQLYADLEKANAAAIQELNGQIGSAATSAYKAPDAIKKKKEIEKQIQEQLNAIDKKKFDHSWPQAVYGYCTETPASDGRNVYVYFSTGISVCYDLNGKRKWIARGPNGGEEKGNFTSPVLMGGQFIVWGGPEMRAYDAETGRKVWSQTVHGANASSIYALRSGKDMVAAYRNYYVRIRDGKAIWDSGNVDNSTQTPIVDGDRIFTWTGGDKGSLKALKIPADSEGGKLETAVTFKTEWPEGDLPKTKERPFDRGIIASPLWVNGQIYRICSGGGLIVNDVTSGDILYTKILQMKPKTEYWAWGGAAVSPSLAGKNIYLMDNQGTTVIIQPGKEYKEVAVNRIEEMKDGKNQVQNLANPFFEGTRIYYRSPCHLYCIVEK